jgi:hypothetical protein
MDTEVIKINTFIHKLQTASDEHCANVIIEVHNKFCLAQLTFNTYIYYLLIHDIFGL